ncbi:MAG: anaerobic ribonucleoside-triphosphate reductase activating protein [Muribaculaceae bacterium]|nr:anaerobic ribonucleoside-triphosphate reductase activating protein [Muribaculaceae bacterium]
MLQVIDIVDGTIVDGPGLRTSIYFAGCRHACEGCHNPQSWDFSAGRPMSIEEIMERVEEADSDVTLTGGDPLYQIDELIGLCRAIRQKGYGIWCYTGFTYEQILADPSLARILDYVDVVVDGPFVLALRDISLRFKGSANQRLVDVRRSRPGEIALWTDQ